jgi:hypothetical protein
MKDLENAILEIIRRLYCCEYVGQITVKQLQSYHECDNSGYELVLGLNCNDKPLRLVSNAANEEEFLKYIVNELRERQLHLTRYFKKYHYDECTTAYE